MQSGWRPRTIKSQLYYSDIRSGVVNFGAGRGGIAPENRSKKNYKYLKVYLKFIIQQKQSIWFIFIRFVITNIILL